MLPIHALELLSRRQDLLPHRHRISLRIDTVDSPLTNSVLVDEALFKFRCSQSCRTIAEAPDLAELIRSFSNVFWKLHAIEKEDMEGIAGHIENQILMARLTGSDPAEPYDPGLFISLFSSTQLRSIYVYNMKMTPRFNRWLECQRHIRVLGLPHDNYWFGDQPAIAVPEPQQLSAPPLATFKILESSPVLAIDARIASDGGIREFAKLLHIHSSNTRRVKIDVIYGPPSVSDVLFIRDLPCLQDLHITGRNGGSLA
ncbi:hypothetical protein FRB96_008903 [Tulasnella sp. 330]|nr:hypothetical protein FRB96_008903 [Tulasnella sp. 330]